MTDTESTTAPVDAPELTAAGTDPTQQTDAGADAGITKEDEAIAGKEATTEVNAPNGEGTAEAAVGPSAVADDDTPASSSKDKKRKSLSGVPEHKTKKLNKKKSMPTLHLECKPGDLYWARLKGYPPWPAVICDEQMLPEQLLASRPVSTARPDGSLRDDFKEGGKNAKERTFAIMFLATNEFSWLVNTSLTPLDPEDCKTKPAGKMVKSLQDAYDLAATNPSLDHFKQVLQTFQEETAALEAEQRAREAELAEKAAEKAAAKAEKEADGKEKKKKSRKSKGGDDEDVEMEDAEVPKSSKKRKKEADSEGDGPKSKKTPKITKLNAPKTPNGESSAKKASTSKPKKKVSAPKAEDPEAAEQKQELSEAEKLAQRERAVLYLRHRLQKCFLSRDQAPKEDEMPAMAEFFTQLENFEDLEPAVIRNTKIHKVLKALIKLTSVPRDEEFEFKKRSHAILEAWNKRMEPDGESATKAAPEKEEPATNGNSASEQAAETSNGVEEDAVKKADELDAKVETKAAEEDEASETVRTAPQTASVEDAPETE